MNAIWGFYSHAEAHRIPSDVDAAIACAAAQSSAHLVATSSKLQVQPSVLVDALMRAIICLRGHGVEL